MNHTCMFGNPVTCALTMIVWLLAASGLLMVTWNKVIGAVTKAKHVKFWQPLLLLVTIGVVCGPGHTMRHHMMWHMGMDCCHSGQGHMGGSGDCPYEHGKKDADDAKK